MTIAAAGNERLEQARNHLQAFILRLERQGLRGRTHARLVEIDQQLETDPVSLTGVVFQQIFNPALLADEIHEQNRASRLSSALFWVEMVRNTAVLVPICLTWYGLWQAMEAFDRMGSQVSGDFLQLWQEGFGGQLSSSLTFGSIALMDFSVLGVVIVLTVLAYMLNRRAESKLEQQADELCAELDQVLWGLTQAVRTGALFTKGDSDLRTLQVLGSIEKFIGEFQQQGEGALNVLAGEQDRLDQLAKQRQAEIGTLKAFSDSLKSSLSGVSQSNREVLNALGQFSEAARQMNDRTNRLAQQQGALTKTLQSLEGHFGRFEAVSHEMNKTLTGSADGMSHAFSGSLQRVDELQNIIAGTQSALDQLLQQQVQNQENLLRSQSDFQTSLGGSIELLTQDLAKNQRLFIDSLERQRSTNENWTQSMIQVTADLGQTIEENRHALQKLAGLPDEMGRLAAALAQIQAHLSELSSKTAPTQDALAGAFREALGGMTSEMGAIMREDRQEFLDTITDRLAHQNGSNGHSKGSIFTRWFPRQSHPAERSES